jgi:hypothetical protein
MVGGPLEMLTPLPPHRLVIQEMDNLTCKVNFL